ncbi:MAG: threonylcarbamoyl-AMP synthase [Anaerolineae bacterium]|nr:threonylcarbamoyl-AMP synthase [Anaerolineae bacterium]
MADTRTQVVFEEDKAALETAANALRAGQVIAFPTDTVYGLGAKVTNPAAIERLYEIKGRDPAKPIAVLIGDAAQLTQLSDEVSPQAAQYAAAFWPGALTLVLKKRPELPAALTTTMNVGIRMPAHAFALELMRMTGALATTSANLSGGENCITAAQVLAQLGGRIPLIIDGGACPTAIPSTVVDCTTTPPRVLREGAISPAQLGL